MERFNQALERDSRMPTSLYGRGLAKEKLGDNASAEEDFAAARQMMPTVEADLHTQKLLP